MRTNTGVKFGLLSMSVVLAALALPMMGCTAKAIGASATASAAVAAEASASPSPSASASAAAILTPAGAVVSCLSIEGVGFGACVEIQGAILNSIHGNTPDEICTGTIGDGLGTLVGSSTLGCSGLALAQAVDFGAVAGSCVIAAGVPNVWSTSDQVADIKLVFFATGSLTALSDFCTVTLAGMTFGDPVPDYSAVPSTDGIDGGIFAVDGSNNIISSDGHSWLAYDPEGAPGNNQGALKVTLTALQQAPIHGLSFGLKAFADSECNGSSLDILGQAGGAEIGDTGTYSISAFSFIKANLPGISQNIYLGIMVPSPEGNTEEMVRCSGMLTVCGSAQHLDGGGQCTN